MFLAAAGLAVIMILIKIEQSIKKQNNKLFKNMKDLDSELIKDITDE
tara:strand:- start:365 stop:505 length:141 start_codon:yes stop_codon:yes gene_type:complete